MYAYCLRLSESNLQGIGGEIEDMYRHQSRAYLSEALTEIVLHACIAPMSVPERLVMEHVMLIALLHNNVGSEVGEYALVYRMYLRHLVLKYCTLEIYEKLFYL